MTMATTSLPAPEIRRPRTNVVGAVMLSAAAFMAFIGVLGVYVLRRAEARDSGEEWFGEGVIELGPSGWIFWTLILSVFTVQWAEWSVRTGDRTNGFWALGLSMLFGAAVLNQLWFIIGDTGFVLAGSEPELLFFVLIGSFIGFLIAAMAALLVTTLRAFIGERRSRESDGVAAAAVYWNTVCVMYWIIWYAVFVTK